MSDKWHGGKGSRPRPLVDTDAFSRNWEKIFNNPVKPVDKQEEKKSPKQ